MGFSDDPLLGMSVDHFSGSATTKLEMTSFSLRTAIAAVSATPFAAS